MEGRRLRRHPVGFTATLPRMAAPKPFRVLCEVRLVLDAATRAHRHR